ncbi:S8 family serine peptidase [Butyrivibrio sp. MC2021]|uniref:S8 family serine peptidase n=1 Tax=Butyrivibrio sp. MC2021 TaxID=1408306 RepID=UPI00047D1509|nr:S8 family serine peptidase [Butyrivibrio sp. MC2021]
MFQKKFKQFMAATLSAAMLIGQTQYVAAADVENTDVDLFEEVEDADALVFDEDVEETEEEVGGIEEAFSEDTEDSEEAVEDSDVETTEETDSVEDGEVILEALDEAEEAATEAAAELPEGVVGMPENYELTESEASIKADSIAKKNEYFANFSLLTEGRDYAKDEVVFLSETAEHAEEVAAAFGGTLKSFENGVAVIDLSVSEVSVEDAYSCAFVENINLPVVTPNYFFDVEELETTEVSEDVVAEDVAEAEEFEDASEETEEEEADIEFASEPYLNAAASAYQWHHDMVDSYSAWMDLGRDGLAKTADVIVAVIDDGIADIAELNLVNDADFDGNHGTMVAGVIGAEFNENGGAGIAPGVQLLNLKSDLSSASVMTQLRAAVLAKADVINMSFGGSNIDPQMASVIDEVYEAGVTMVAAVGSDEAATYPAAYANVISVSAVGKDGDAQAVVNSDIAAPGSDILTTDTDNSYVMASGSALASSVVAGASALYMTKYGHVSPEAMKNLLVASTDVNENSENGTGVINVSKLLGANVTAGKQPLTSLTFSGKNYSSAAGVFYAPKGGSCKITAKGNKGASTKSLTWTVSPANAGVTVSNKGVVKVDKTVAENKTFTVTARSGSVSKNCTVQVVTKTKTISASQKSLKLGVAARGSIKTSGTVSVKVENSSLVNFKSSNEKVVSISRSNNNVTITARGKGSAKVTASAADGSGKKVTISVKVVVPVDSIAVTPSVGKRTQDAFVTGSSYKFKKTVYGVNGLKPSSKKVTWKVHVYLPNGAEIKDQNIVKKVATVKGGKISAKSNAISYLQGLGLLGSTTVNKVELEYVTVKAEATAADGSDAHMTSRSVKICQRPKMFGFPQSSRWFKIYVKVDAGYDGLVTGVVGHPETIVCPTKYNITSSNKNILEVECVPQTYKGRTYYLAHFIAHKAGTVNLTVQENDGAGTKSSIECQVYGKKK